MSSIPNSAMPTAGPAADDEGETQTLVQRAADLVRDNPKTAIAAGAAVAAGVAAAAIPLVRGRRSSGGGTSSGSGTSSGGGRRAGKTGGKKKG